MERAIEYLSDVYSLDTPEWSAWAATKRPARLAGTWTISGHEPGKGPIFGTMTVTADPSDPDVFTTASSYVYAESGEQVERSGRTMVYTGYQWRGRSNPGGADELREVMFVERDQQTMWGRWFRGDYDEIGPDISMTRVGGGAVVTGVHPRAVRRGGSTDVTVYGVGLSQADDLDFGAGISVDAVRATGDGTLRVTLQVDADADVGVLEVDEAALPAVVDAVHPRVLVLGNLFRDQLDRHGELEMVADRWRAMEIGRAHV